MPNQKFSSLAIQTNILDNLASLGYEHMSPIQELSLPELLQNKDIIAQAKTGSGKTAAFAITLLSKLDISSKTVQALVLCPTRELSEQVCKETRKIARLIPNVKILSLCGGSSMSTQADSLWHGAHCIVGTPGRVLDHLRKENINLDNLKIFILDEADRMLDMGFLESISQIAEYLPKIRQTALFSATYPKNIQDLSNKFQNKAIFISLDTEQQNQDIEQLFYKTNKSQKFDLLCDLLIYHKPESSIVFCNTKQKCHELAEDLCSQGFYAQAIHGDLDQRARDEALVLFANKSSSILVASDVAARGLDIKDLPAVINFEVSRDPEIHLHRIGRTGRAGKKGLALSIVSEEESFKLKALELFQNQAIVFADISEISSKKEINLVPPMATLRIASGRKNKLRTTDILGALCAGNIISSQEIGKIEVCDFHSFVAVARDKIDLAFKLLTRGKIKGRNYKINILT